MTKQEEVKTMAGLKKIEVTNEKMNPRADQWHWPCQPIRKMQFEPLLCCELRDFRKGQSNPRVGVVGIFAVFCLIVVSSLQGCNRFKPRVVGGYSGRGYSEVQIGDGIYDVRLGRSYAKGVQWCPVVLISHPFGRDYLPEIEYGKGSLTIHEKSFGARNTDVPVVVYIPRDNSVILADVRLSAQEMKDLWEMASHGKPPKWFCKKMSAIDSPRK